MLKIVAVDDEIHVLKRIVSTLEKCADTQVVKTFSDSQKALNWFKKNFMDIDAVFLDVSMPVFDGFAIANVLLDLNEDISVIFITAHEQYAVKAFDVSAIDYILKPATLERMNVALQRVFARKSHLNKLSGNASSQLKNLPKDELWEKKKLKAVLRKNMSQKNLDRVLLSSGTHWQWIEASSIRYFYKDKKSKYVQVVSTENVYEATENLKNFHESTSSEKFVKCYRNIFVNTNYIELMTKNPENKDGALIILKDSSITLPVSRSYVDSVFFALYGEPTR